MKNYTDIIREKQDLLESIRRLEESTRKGGPVYDRRKQLREEGKGIFFKDLPEEEQAELIRQQEEYDRERQVEREALTLQSIQLEILDDNERQAFRAQVMPQVLEIWNSYAGKSYGPKTKQKIRNEIAEATGVYFYVDSQLWTSGGGNMVLTAKSYDRTGYTFIPVWGTKILTEDNKVCTVDLEDLRLEQAKDYVDDPEARANEIANEWDNLLGVYQKLVDACESYNKLLPAGMRHMIPYAFDSNMGI